MKRITRWGIAALLMLVCAGISHGQLPTIFSDLNNRTGVTTAIMENYTVSTTEGNEAGHMVKAKIVLATPTQANDMALEYYEISNSTWMPLTFNASGELLWGPSTGFPLSNASSSFRVTFAAAGTYSYSMTIVDAATEAPVSAVTNESVTVNAPYVAPVISSDLHNRANVVTGIQEQFSVTTVANSEAGHMVKVQLALVNPAQANDIALEYYEISNSTWMPLTFNVSGELLWGPSTGFPLMDASSQFRITFAASGTYDYSLTIVDASTNAAVGSAANESVFVDINVGIETVNNASVNVYPNPSSSVVKVEAPGMEDATVAIYNMIGKKVTAVQKINGQALIDIADLAKGVYFVRIETKSNVITKKINVIK